MNVALAMVDVSRCAQTPMADIFVNVEQDSRESPTIHMVVKVDDAIEFIVQWLLFAFFDIFQPFCEELIYWEYLQ